MANDDDSWDYEALPTPAQTAESAGGFDWSKLVTSGLDFVLNNQRQQQNYDLQRMQLEQPNQRYMQTRDGRIIRAGEASMPAGGGGGFGLSPMVMLMGGAALIAVLLLARR